MYTQVYDAGFSSQVIYGGAIGDTPLRVSLYVKPVSAALLSSVTVTVSWHDGAQARSVLLVVPLTSLLGGKWLDPTEIYLGDTKDLAISASLLGGGTFSIGYTLEAL